MRVIYVLQDSEGRRYKTTDARTAEALAKVGCQCVFVDYSSGVHMRRQTAERLVGNPSFTSISYSAGFVSWRQNA